MLVFLFIRFLTEYFNRFNYILLYLCHHFDQDDESLWFDPFGWASADV